MKKLENYLIFLIQFTYFYCCSQERLIAKDEGFYLLASQLVLEGKIPYLDFFYPQSPLLPYIYSIIHFLPFDVWSSARGLSALFTSLAALLMYLIIKRRSNYKYAIMFLLLFSTSNFVFPWYPNIKSYAVSLLCIILAYYLLFPDSSALTKTKALIAGIILGVAISSRIMMLPLCLLFPCYIFFARIHRNKLLQIFSGMFLGLLPLLSAFIINFDLAWFNNFEYHESRWLVTEELSDQHLWKIILTIIGFRDANSFTAWHLPIIFWLFICCVLVRLYKKRNITLSALLALSSIFVNLLPEPVYLQYFCISFVLMLFDIFLNYDLNKLFNKSNLAKCVSIVLLVLYFIGFRADFNSYLETGKGVIGISRHVANHWKLERIIEIRSKIRELASGKEIISLWPGYVVGTGAKAYPGTENHFAYAAAKQFSIQQMNNYKLIDYQEIANVIETRTVQLLVLSQQDLTNRKIKNAVTNNYKLTTRIEPISFYEPKL